MRKFISVGLLGIMSISPTVATVDVQAQLSTSPDSACASSLGIADVIRGNQSHIGMLINCPDRTLALPRKSWQSPSRVRHTAVAAHPTLPDAEGLKAGRVVVFDDEVAIIPAGHEGQVGAAVLHEPRLIAFSCGSSSTCGGGPTTPSATTETVGPCAR
ncbi:hypothetical protein [Micromonospora sp. NPDC005203]|uniref:hypothetical protein n=1 Tax=Micromonospora sp. NPDC005203 TaxID=3364226 RepID=UPI0036B5B939